MNNRGQGHQAATKGCRCILPRWEITSYLVHPEQWASTLSKKSWPNKLSGSGLSVLFVLVHSTDSKSILKGIEEYGPPPVATYKAILVAPNTTKPATVLLWQWHNPSGEMRRSLWLKIMYKSLCHPGAVNNQQWSVRSFHEDLRIRSMTTIHLIEQHG